jgi:hypothetical protein
LGILLHNAGNDCIARGRVHNPRADCIFEGICVAASGRDNAGGAGVRAAHVAHWRLAAGGWRLAAWLMMAQHSNKVEEALDEFHLGVGGVTNHIYCLLVLINKSLIIHLNARRGMALLPPVALQR